MTVTSKYIALSLCVRIHFSAVHTRLGDAVIATCKYGYAESLFTLDGNGVSRGKTDRYALL
jgi:hypothetical protein